MALAAQEEEAAIAAADEADDDEEVEDEPRRSLAVVLSSTPAGSAGPSAPGGGAPVGSAAARVRDLLRDGSEGSSGIATPVGLKRALETESDPGKEGQEKWRENIMRTVSALERAGHPPKDEDLERCIRKGSYAFKLRGFDLSGQVAYVKRTFGEVLLVF